MRWTTVSFFSAVVTILAACSAGATDSTSAGNGQLTTPTPLPSTPSATTGSSKSGSCMVRDAASSIGTATDPDVGPGYAKVEIPGVDDLPGLHAACTDAVYRDLIAKHCAVSHTPVQRVAVTWDANGSFVSEGGPTGSNEPIACP